MEPAQFAEHFDLLCEIVRAFSDHDLTPADVKIAANLFVGGCIAPAFLSDAEVRKLCNRLGFGDRWFGSSLLKLAKLGLVLRRPPRGPYHYALNPDWKAPPKEEK
jgi:hypothetical protein